MARQRSLGQAAEVKIGLATDRSVQVAKGLDYGGALLLRLRRSSQETKRHSAESMRKSSSWMSLQASSWWGRAISTFPRHLPIWCDSDRAFCSGNILSLRGNGKPWWGTIRPRSATRPTFRLTASAGISPRNSAVAWALSPAFASACPPRPSGSTPAGLAPPGNSASALGVRSSMIARCPRRPGTPWVSSLWPLDHVQALVSRRLRAALSTTNTMWSNAP